MPDMWHHSLPMYTLNTGDKGPPQSWLDCTTIHREFSMGITACHATNVLLDTARTQSASCLKERPGYQCFSGRDDHMFFVTYGDNAFQPMSQQGAACSVTPTRHFFASRFDYDSARDVMAAFPGGFVMPRAPGDNGQEKEAEEEASEVQCKPADPADLTLRVPGRTMFVPRMYRDHTNIYHSISDMFHAFTQAISFGWTAGGGSDGSDGSGGGVPECMGPTGRAPGTCTLSLVVEDIRILFVDEYLERPLEHMWEDLFTRPLFLHAPPAPPGAGGAATARTWTREVPSEPHLSLPPRARRFSDFGLPQWSTYISAQTNLSAHLAGWQAQRGASTRRSGGGERDVLFPITVAGQPQHEQQQQQMQSLQDATTGVHEAQDAPSLLARAAVLSPGVTAHSGGFAPKLLFEEWGLSSPTFTSIFHGTTRAKIAHSGGEQPYWGSGSSSSTVYSDVVMNTNVPRTASGPSYWDLLHAALPPGRVPAIRLLPEGAPDGRGSGGAGSGVAAGPHHMTISPGQQYWTVNSGRSTVLMQMFRRQLLAKVTSALSGASAGKGAGGDGGSHSLREAFSVTLEFDITLDPPVLDAVCVNSASLLRLDTVLWPLHTSGTAGPDVDDERPPVLRITIIQRQSPGGPPASRGISNIKELVAELQDVEYGVRRSNSTHGSAGEAMGRTQVQVVQLHRLTPAEQFNIMRYTDILVAMHGAALVHLLSLPPWAAVMELDTSPPAHAELEGEHEVFEACCTAFESFSMWGGIEYVRLEENTVGRFRYVTDMPQCSVERIVASKLRSPAECRRLKRPSTSEVDLLAMRHHVGTLGVRVLERKEMHAALRHDGSDDDDDDDGRKDDKCGR